MKVFRVYLLLALPLALLAGCGDEQDSRLTDEDVLCLKVQRMGGSCGGATGTGTGTSTVTVTTSTVATDTATVTVTSTLTTY